MAAVIASSFIAPNFAWREGALLSALVVVPSIWKARQPAAADLAAVAVPALAFASLLWTSSPGLTLTTSLNLTAGAGMFVAIRATCERRRDVWLLAGGFLLGAVIAAVAAVSNSPDFRWSYQSAAPRIGVEGVNVNFTAYSLVTASAVFAALVIFRSTRKDYFVLAGAGVFVAAVYLGVVLTGARAALLSLVGLIVWVIGSRFLPRVGWWALIGVYILANAVIAFGWLDAALRGALTRSARETGDLNGRLGVWPLARHVFSEHWLLGAGAGSLPSDPANTTGINAHTMILDVAAGLGVLGVVAFGLVWILAFRAPVVGADERVTRAVGAFLVASLPVILSGFWFESIVLWSAIGLFSRISLLAPAAVLPTLIQNAFPQSNGNPPPAREAL